jgi:putative salt-induced outer membrane protein
VPRTPAENRCPLFLRKDFRQKHTQFTKKPETMITTTTKGPRRFLWLAITAVFVSAALNTKAQTTATPITAPPLWQGGATLGLTLTRGNSDTLLFTAKVITAKKWDRNELEFGADAAYGEQDGDKNNETYHGYGQYNRLFTERTYGLLRLEALHDGIADIYYRVALSTGVGYYFIKNERTFLRAEAGPGVVFERKGTNDDIYATLRIAERFEHKITKTAFLWESVEFLPQVDRWGNFTINSEIGLSVDINTKWSLKPYIQDSYVNEPAPGRKKNDIKLVLAMGYKF